MTLSADPSDRSAQLVFDLPHGEARGLADFMQGKANQTAFEFLLAWPHWPHPATFLCGPSGSGKSHLARIWAERLGATIVAAREANLMLIEPDRPLRLVIEDCGRGSVDEHSLFHLFNHCLESDGALLFSADVPPARLGLILPDLISRLRAATLVQIDPPDDELIKAVLVKLFADRQIDMSSDIAGFAIARMERSFGAARTLVECVDWLSLAEGRRITKQLVARALREMSASNAT